MWIKCFKWYLQDYSKCWLYYVKPGSQYDAGATSVVNVMEKVFFISQIASLTLHFSTIWLVGCWLTLSTLRWNRNRVYSSITPTLATLRWRECHIVNQALTSYPPCLHKGLSPIYNYCWFICDWDQNGRILWIYKRARLHVCTSVHGSWLDQDALKAPLISWSSLKTLLDHLIVGLGRPWLLDFILILVTDESAVVY